MRSFEASTVVSLGPGLRYVIVSEQSHGDVRSSGQRPCKKIVRDDPRVDIKTKVRVGKVEDKRRQRPRKRSH